MNVNELPKPSKGQLDLLTAPAEVVEDFDYVGDLTLELTGQDAAVIRQAIDHYEAVRGPVEGQTWYRGREHDQSNLAGDVLADICRSWLQHCHYCLHEGDSRGWHPQGHGGSPSSFDAD